MPRSRPIKRRPPGRGAAGRGGLWDDEHAGLVFRNTAGGLVLRQTLTKAVDRCASPRASPCRPRDTLRSPQSHHRAVVAGADIEDIAHHVGHAKSPPRGLCAGPRGATHGDGPRCRSPPGPLIVSREKTGFKPSLRGRNLSLRGKGLFVASGLSPHYCELGGQERNRSEPRSPGRPPGLRGGSARRTTPHRAEAQPGYSVRTVPAEEGSRWSTGKPWLSRSSARPRR